MEHCVLVTMHNLLVTFSAVLSLISCFLSLSQSLMCAMQYYAKVSEGMSWLNLKHSLVALREYGKDEDSTQALIKKHEAIELEIEGYEAKIEELQGESQRLIDGGHFDSETITEREVRSTFIHMM